MSENNLTKRPETLPSNVDDMVARRTSMRQRTLNDYVDDGHVALYTDPKYREALEAVYDEDAVEGSCAVDNVLAATMIREYAKTHNITQVANKKLATIVKALRVVLKRYHISREERKNTVGGVLITDQRAAAE